MTAMNIAFLEKVARQALKGEDVAEESNKSLGDGVISAAEHRSLQSLSWQIAANVQAGGNVSDTMAWAVPARAWLSPGSGTLSVIRPSREWL